MTSRIDELVAGLAPVRDDEVTGEPTGPAGRELLAAVLSGEPAPPRRRRLALRLAAGAVTVTAVAAALVAGLTGWESEPLRSYANAAVAIDVEGEMFEVRVKDAHADQREFREAFARFGLDVRLRVVPVSPRRQRDFVQVRALRAEPVGEPPPGGVTGTHSTELECTPGQDVCALKVGLGGELYRRHGADILIGRAARPGEVYTDAYPAAGDRPASLGLTGRTVGEALAELRRRGLGAAFTIGAFNLDGSGSMWEPPQLWRPAADRRVTGAWMRSSNSVGLLVAPAKGDPGPLPVPSD
ncbi:hypothetical protein [Actinomadura rifamycini]|uniref:hypothetical protein n=1 Tax=Actinomadura rifamycini TaxID=31962 RepID=UPI0003F6BF58|nr:hypothetical protein [Actinomadura rifamycini]